MFKGDWAVFLILSGDLVFLGCDQNNCPKQGTVQGREDCLRYIKAIDMKTVYDIKRLCHVDEAFDVIHAAHVKIGHAEAEE